MLTKSKFFVAFIVSAFTFSAFAQEAAEDSSPWTAVVDLKTIEASLDGENITTSVYNSLSYEFDNKDTLTFEMRNDFLWRKDDVNDFTGVFYWIRIPYTQKNIAKLGNFDFNMTYRYTVPAGAALQKQGALGVVLVRPNLTGAFGPVTLEFYSGFYGFLQRKAYNVHYTTKEDAAGNPFFLWVPQTVISWNIGAGFTLVADLSLSLTYHAKGRQDVVNKPDSYWAREFDQDYAVKYSNPALAGFDVYAGAAHNSKFYTDAAGKKNDFKFFTKAATVYLGTAKAF